MTKEYLTRDLTGMDVVDIEAALNDMWTHGYWLSSVAQHQVWGSDRIRSIYVFKRRARSPKRVAD